MSLDFAALLSNLIDLLISSLHKKSAATLLHLYPLADLEIDFQTPNEFILINYLSNIDFNPYWSICQLVNYIADEFIPEHRV